MPASTNPQINAWADTRARTIADKVVQLRYAIDAYLIDYAAGGIATLIGNDGGGNLVGVQDSRVPITGTQVINQKAAILALQTALEVPLVAGVGATAAAINDAIQVNGSPR